MEIDMTGMINATLPKGDWRDRTQPRRILDFLRSHPGRHTWRAVAAAAGMESGNAARVVLSRLKAAGVVCNPAHGWWEIAPEMPLIISAVELDAMKFPARDVALMAAIRRFVKWARDSGVIELAQARELWKMAADFDPEIS